MDVEWWNVRMVVGGEMDWGSKNGWRNGLGIEEWVEKWVGDRRMGGEMDWLLKNILDRWIKNLTHDSIKKWMDWCIDS